MHGFLLVAIYIGQCVWASIRMAGFGISEEVKQVKGSVLMVGECAVGMIPNVVYLGRSDCVTTIIQ